MYINFSNNIGSAPKHSNAKRMKQEGDMGVYGIAVLSFFSSGISVILIFNDCAVLRYHPAVRYTVFHPSG